MKHLFDLLTHPYPRYGLAAALVQESCSPAEFITQDEKQIAALLVRGLQAGLGEFRMESLDNPQLVDTLEYRPIDLEVLQEKATLVQSAGLAMQGKYLFPSVVTTDGGASDTFKNVEDMIRALRAGKSLLTRTTFSRSFAPTTAKINQNGRASLSEPPGTLFEAACAAIATVTPLKPAAWIGQRNTGVFPDLPLDKDNDALYQFIDIFRQMQTSEIARLMYSAPVKKQALTPAASVKPRFTVSKKSDAVKPKSEFRRPRLHSGNYPGAPQRESGTFGTAGLLGAIGRWAHSNEAIDRAHPVLESLKNCPFYIVSYDAISQEQFNHHVIRLAQANKLSDIVNALTYDTLLYAEMEQGRPSWDAPARKLFTLFASRFLQSFDVPAFRDFLSTRAEYPLALHPLFEEFFMNQEKISAEIVHAARQLGAWINRAAYRAAEADVKKDASVATKSEKERYIEVLHRKSRILVSLDGMAMGSCDATAMIGSIVRETRMLTDYDVPEEAIPFLDAANAGGAIGMETARQLLMTYMRVSNDAKSHRRVAGDAPDDPTLDTAASDGDASDDTPSSRASNAD